MDWQGISTALSRMAHPFPLAAAEEARARWDELAPLFIVELERVANGGSTLIDGATWECDGLFSFAVYLAAEKRDVRAYGALVRICHCSTERAHELFGDDVGTQLGRMLASVCDGDIGPLKALAEDSAADMWCRYAALHALAVRVVEGEGDRDEVLAYIEALAEREADVLRRVEPDDETDNEFEPDDFLTWAIDAASELGPAPLLEKIRGWFGEGLINPGVTGLKWFEKKAAMPAADCIAEAATKEENRFIRDGLDEMTGWICYQPPKPKLDRRPQVPVWPAYDPHSGGTPIRSLPKVGRNDPCPCGSGKKFKKCCGKESSEVVVGESKDGGVGRAIEWLTSRHGKAVKTAVQNMLNDDLDNEEQAALQKIGDDDWQGVQINAMEWLLAEGSIAVKGAQRNVAELLLAPGGPAFGPGQRSWIEQLRRQPLRLYDITEVLPGVGMRLCDALDTEAAPLMVQERSGSAHARIGNLIGVRVMEADGHLEMSGAAYPFSRLMNTALLAELRAAVDESAAHGDHLPQVLSEIIRRNWIAQYARPLPLPTVIDSHSGDPILLITDHYRVKSRDALAAVLATQPDIEGDSAAGWARLIDCADGQTRQTLAINPGKSAEKIEVFYKTQNYADQGRPWFEALAGASVEFAGRVLSDPKRVMQNMATGKAAPPATAAPDLPPEVLAEAIEKVLRRSYANWSDEPIQALGGKTPRQAIKTPAGLERVKGLLRSYEEGEKDQAVQQGRREISYDFLWESIGLGRPE
jgi:hypothetical protein